MHTVTAPRRDNMTLVIPAPKAPGNLFRIADQVAMAKAADKRGKRRKMKEARKARSWRPD
jgi:hypothetical protein